MAGIVTDAKQAELMAEYDKWIAASDPALAPKHPEFKGGTPGPQDQANWAKYNEDLAKFRSSPGFAIRERAKKKVLDTFPPGVSADNPQIQAMIQAELIENRKSYEAGLNEGIKDGSHLNNAMNALFQFPPQIFTAIKQLFLSIPLVGDALAAGGKSFMSLFSGKPINPLTAFDQVKTERAMAGGLSRLGITDKPSVDAITSRVVSGGGFPGLPEKVLGRAYSPNAPEISKELDKLNASPEVIQIRKDNPTANLQVMTVNGPDGKPLTVIGSRVTEGTNDKFVIKGIFKTSEEGKLVKLDARMPDGRSVEGQDIILVNGAIAEIGTGIVNDAVGRLTQADKAYAPGAPEVSARVAEANKIPGIATLTGKADSAVIVTKDADGKDIVLVGTRSGENFRVEAVLKTAADGKTLIEAVKLPEGTKPLVGETITLAGGALPADAATKVKSEIASISANEMKPGKAYSIESQETEFKQLKSRLFSEKPDMYDKIINQGSSLMLMRDKENKPVLVVGRVAGGTFTPDALLKADAAGKLQQLTSDLVGKPLEYVPAAGSLSSNSFVVLKAAAEKQYRDDGREVVVMSDALREAATKYAETRYVDLVTGDVDKAKVQEFVNRYSDLVVKAGMSEEAQKARAESINVRTTAARTKLGVAVLEAAKDAESAGATVSNPDDARYSTMKDAIKEALDILEGKKKVPTDNALDESLKEVMTGTLLPAPSTPKATAAGLGKAFGMPATGK